MIYMNICDLDIMWYRYDRQARHVVVVFLLFLFSRSLHLLRLTQHHRRTLYRFRIIAVHSLYSVASHQSSLEPGDAYRIYMYIIYIYIHMRQRTIIIGSENGLPPDRRRAIIWTSDDLLSVGCTWTHFSEIYIKMRMFSLIKLHLRTCLQITAILSHLCVCVPCLKALDGDLSCHFMAYFTTWCKIFPVMFYSEIAKISPFARGTRFLESEYPCINSKPNICEVQLLDVAWISFKHIQVVSQQL